jgi:hypothetical protein
MKRSDSAVTEDRKNGLKRREFFATAGKIGIAALAGKCIGLDLLASAVADRMTGGYGSLRRGTVCSDGSAYSCDSLRVDCDGTFSCDGEVYGCTERMFVCRSIFTCSGPGGGHNCTWRVKFFCEDTHSCSPESHYHNCVWPHGEPIEPVPSQDKEQPKFGQ